MYSTFIWTYLRDIKSELERMVENEGDAGSVWCCPA